MKTLSFFYHLVLTSIRASITMRAAFLFELVLMIGNNLIFFSMWWIFFLRFNDIGGWQIDDMAASMAILTGSYGLSQVLFGGIKDLGRAILNGDLDPFMTQPKNLLLHVISSKSRSKGWGHLMTSFVLMMIGNVMQEGTLPLILVMIVSGCMILTSAGIIIHSLSFWLGSIELVSQKYLDSLFVFSLYPTNIYSGLLQLLMFTVIPAGLIGYLPVQLLREFSWMRLLLIVGSALFFAWLAFSIFYRGLKRYESGNKFGMRF